MDKKEMIKIVEENINKLENKDFNVYFFVMDTKGNPSSQLEYIYQTALELKNLGYKVSMIHQDDDFVGVEDWLGEEYAKLPHYNTKKENVELSAADFLFIPEILANVMMQTKRFPCKRVAIVQNAMNITEFMPVSQTFENLSITDAIVTTEAQQDKLKDFFPEVRTHIVSPAISELFHAEDKPQKLIVNIVSREQSNVNRVVKPFYWKNPIYKFISFRDLRGLGQDAFAEALREAAITIWMDDSTAFGYSLLEALRSGSMVFAKVPEHVSDWMTSGDTLTNSVIWFDSVESLVDMLPSAIRSWTIDKIPASVYENQAKTAELYPKTRQVAEIKQSYVKELFDKRLNEFKEVLVDLNNKEENE